MAGEETGKPVTIEPSGFTPLDPNAQKTAHRKSPARLLLLTCLILFGVVMAFLLSARSLQIVVVAQTPANISISGLALPFGERYLIRPGTHTVNVTAPGYHPLETEITVEHADSQTIELMPQALPGLLSVNSLPQGATISLDGEPLGKTPLQAVPVAAGEHQLLLEDPRHLPVQQLLQITGRNIKQQLELQMEPAWAAVSISSLPPGATILLDGETIGTTPATLEILQGEHQLMLQRDTYAPWQQTLQITAGAAQDLGQVKMQAAAGALELASVPSGANVTLDGEFQGQTPLTLQLSPDQAHRLAVFKPGYRRYNSSVQLPAAGSDQQTVKLEAKLGEVRFRISPDNALLKINGKARGSGSQTLSLPAVGHSVEISLQGYASVRRRITPRPGLPQLVEVTLLTQQDARMARIQSEITTSVGQTLLLFNPAESPLASFTMGASRREPGRRANEVLHPVSLQRMFYLQTTEVTNAQFRQFHSSHNSGQIEGNSLNREHQPVVQVSWQQAASFCNWLSKREKLPLFYRENQGIITGFNPSSTGYRLPTEAEWAWAARAKGEKLLKFPWGETFPPTSPVANYADNTSAYVTGRILNGYTDGHVVSATVASFGANHHALFDMEGNVAEWTHDVYSIPSANASTVVDPLGSQTGDNYVLRGAGWAHAKLSELRLSYRDYGQAGRDDVGFRIARYAE